MFFKQKTAYEISACLVGSEMCIRDRPNVVFPCAALCDAPTGRIALYYGCADTVTGLAFCQADEIVAFIREHAM